MIPFARLLVVLAVAVAMTGSSFVHRVAPLKIDENLLAYVAAGGAIDDLCGDAGFGLGGMETCDACRLVDGAAVPTVDVVAFADVDARALGSLIAASVAPVALATNPSCPVRAPPIV